MATMPKSLFIDMPEGRRDGLGLGALLMAMPLALLMTALFVAGGSVAPVWAVPFYGLVGGGLTIGMSAGT